MSPRLYRHHLVFLFSLALLLPLTTGCSSFLANGALPFLTAKAETPELPPTDVCTVELHGEFGKPKRMTLPVTPETRAQQILEAVGAQSRFRKMDVVILRPTPGQPQTMVKLVCNYDPSNREITWQSDYGVLPGDRIMIRQDTSTFVDDWVEGILGPVLTKRQR